MLMPSNNFLPVLREDLYERFLQYADVSPASANTYRRALRQLQRYFSENGISAPARADMLEYKRRLMDEKKASTAQSYLSAAKVFFAWLESESLYPDICRGIKSVKISRGFKKDYLTPDMMRMVLDSIPDTPTGRRDRAILTLMTTCALRTCEVSRALISDLRPRGGNSVLYILGKGDTDRTDYCIVPPQVEKLIRAYLAERGETDSDAPLFASSSNMNRGEHMSARSISAICKHYLQASGFSSDRLTAHSLRHTAVTLAMMDESTDLHQVQQFARHKSIATTTIYAHELENRDNIASGAVAKAIF